MMNCDICKSKFASVLAYVKDDEKLEEIGVYCEVCAKANKARVMETVTLHPIEFVYRTGSKEETLTTRAKCHPDL